MAGDREEHVVQVGGVNRQILDLDAGAVEPAEQAAQRSDGAIARHLQGKLLRVGLGGSEQPGGLA